MHTPYEIPGAPTSAPAYESRSALVRAGSGRMLAGVCRGIGDHLGVDARLVRLGFVLLVLLGGAGLPAYLFLWATVPSARREDANDRSRVFSVGLISLGVAALGAAALAAAGLGFSDLRNSALVPGLVIALGAVIAWSNLDDAQQQNWLGGGATGKGYTAARLALGVGLAVVGILVILTRGQSVAAIWDSLLAAAGVLLGFVLIAAPWVVRLWSDYRRESIAAARASERADIAAHLHDSVLQTLALIQRQSSDPAAVTRLARAQERELRTWLYAGPTGSSASLAPAATAAAHEVEDISGVPIELVVTGDAPLDEHGLALVAAFKEALSNAVRHGRSPVTAYVEVGVSEVEAFVRDRGEGFELGDVPEDRLGVRQSIIARMERHGGSAQVRRREDGTEVQLRLPREGESR